MGRIEVICGSMFSGKTEELINRIISSKKSFRVFKPLTDTRNKKNKIISHSKIEIDATS
jgi:thymidine kinase